MAQHYCDAAIGDPLHAPYHDREYGFPIADDNGLFARLVLEINQAGLSWATILKKKANFTVAYDDFDIAIVAAYDEAARARLLADARIIRNRLKVNAAIENARRLLDIRASEGSFKAWLDLLQDDRATESWMLANTKPCPVSNSVSPLTPVPIGRYFIAGWVTVLCQLYPSPSRPMHLQEQHSEHGPGLTRLAIVRCT